MESNSNINNINKDKSIDPVQWIEGGILNHYIEYHDYDNFQNMENIGSGAFGDVYKTNYKDSNTTVALKSFKGQCIMKEIVNELQLLKVVHFHENIIKFFGITKRKGK
ncbi:hypothetical protein C1645_415452 [Glomus cerebriforme]|uniref:mitogen-activated protein kinase kinase n=1 Tax=Glomus cerebriforme TaxID=658196 RepID=A0A397SJX7_9GLOM|nr:hypothetical protein C1645_415452 [Glomus cerebriforme]